MSPREDHLAFASTLAFAHKRAKDREAAAAAAGGTEIDLTDATVAATAYVVEAAWAATAAIDERIAA